MEFLSKFEDFINNLIIRMGELFIRVLKKLFPPPAMRVINWFLRIWQFLVANFRNLPRLMKEFLMTAFLNFKATLISFNFKAQLAATYNQALIQYKQKKSNVGQVRTILLAPILIIGEWLKGLSANQALLLLTFSGGSILSVIAIISSGHRLASKQGEESRAPASVEEELLFDRPEYYKRQFRLIEFTNLRLPVYFAKINEVKTVDIDFNVRLSNRQTTKFLSKKEFQLRDHLLLNVEPMAASFPLEEEGKEILKKKIWMEIDDFLKAHNIDGSVEDLKITYILAN